MPASDTWGPMALSSPRKAFAISPHDTNELTNVTRSLLVGVAGDVKVVMADDVLADAVVLKLPVGIHEIAVRQVLATGTTATNLVGLF